MGNYLRSFTIIVGLLLSTLNVFSQTNYSEKALTGRGDLNFVGEKYKLQNKVFDAFELMQKEAFKEGVSIQIVSAYRSFEHQKKIWDKKFTSYLSMGLTPEEAIGKIIQYSAIPGASRHHWGTDIDIIESSVVHPKSVLAEKNYSSGGVYEKLKKWMDSNSEKFGFYLVYTNETGRKGFKYEPWHYSFKLISKPMLHSYLKVDIQQYFKKMHFNGISYLTTEILKKYAEEHIRDINPNLY